MKFIIDENIPTKLQKFLSASGHDIVGAEISTPDPVTFDRAKLEKRILLTLDTDFIQLFKNNPESSKIILFRIHPPYVNDLIKAIDEFLKNTHEAEIKGLILLSPFGHLRFLK
jgi:predicted nuclease of predicted toxin-antitoxin system